MEILDEIHTWINDRSNEPTKNFFWLLGPPGCGKSFITASVVRQCKSRLIAAAQFFINRNDPNTTNPLKYFPTVRREVAKQSGAIEQHLHDKGTIILPTAANYIDNVLRIRGREGLDDVLDQFRNEAMTDINTLYRTILEDAYPEKFSDDWSLETFRRLMGILMVLPEPIDMDQLIPLLALRRTPDSKPVDIKNFVDRLKTIFVTFKYKGCTPGVHKSFFDYITSTGEHVPDRFRVNVEASNAELALSCLRSLTLTCSTFRGNHYASSTSDLALITYPFSYAVRHILLHISRLNTMKMPVILDQSKPVDLNHFDASLRRIYHPNQTGPLVVSLAFSHDLVRTSFENKSLVWRPTYGYGCARQDLHMSKHRLARVRFSGNGRRIFVKRPYSFEISRFSWPSPPKLSFTPLDCYDSATSDLVTEPAPPLTAFALTFDGTKIAIGYVDGTAVLRDIDPPATSSLLPIRHQGKINVLSIS
ncbi:hypothetical protein H0H87_003347 [Tephrocybe sp. NHM501043]|nr:hypothetical protein H0H87_003347 [Tephrocybe sp. NHM501043]